MASRRRGAEWRRSPAAGPQTCRLTLADNRGEHTIGFGLTDWREGRDSLGPGDAELALVQAERAADGRLALTILLVDQGFHWTALIDEQAGTLELLFPLTIRPEGQPLLARQSDPDQGQPVG